MNDNNETNSADAWVGRPFEQDDTITLGYVMSRVESPDTEFDYEMVKMCSNCAEPRDVLRAESRIPAGQGFGDEIPYPMCDSCEVPMHPETATEVDQDEVVEAAMEEQ